jgi:hypothetical protein
MKFCLLLTTASILLGAPVLAQNYIGIINPTCSDGGAVPPAATGLPISGLSNRIKISRLGGNNSLCGNVETLGTTMTASPTVPFGAQTGPSGTHTVDSLTIGNIASPLDPYIQITVAYITGTSPTVAPPTGTPPTVTPPTVTPPIGTPPTVTPPTGTPPTVTPPTVTPPTGTPPTGTPPTTGTPSAGNGNIVTNSFTVSGGNSLSYTLAMTGDNNDITNTVSAGSNSQLDETITASNGNTLTNVLNAGGSVSFGLSINSGNGNNVSNSVNSTSFINVSQTLAGGANGVADQVGMSAAVGSYYETTQVTGSSNGITNIVEGAAGADTVGISLGSSGNTVSNTIYGTGTQTSNLVETGNSRIDFILAAGILGTPIYSSSSNVILDNVIGTGGTGQAAVNVTQSGNGATLFAAVTGLNGATVGAGGFNFTQSSSNANATVSVNGSGSGYSINVKQ